MTLSRFFCVLATLGLCYAAAIKKSGYVDEINGIEVAPWSPEMYDFRSNNQETTQGWATTKKPQPNPQPEPQPEPEPEPEQPGTTCSCGKANSKSLRIVNGQNAEANEFPWQVALFSNYGQQFDCGGSIVSKRHVVTAAHCVEHPDAAYYYKVAVGAHNKAKETLTKLEVKKITNHPNWNRKTLDSDLSIIELSEDLAFDAKVSPICLPSKNEDYSGKTATISGWGRIYGGGPGADILQKAQFSVWSAEQCSRTWGAGYTTRMLCAGGNSQTGVSGCNGDSGGPITVLERGHHELIGATSFGPKTCSANDGPSVYARISETSLYDFVMTHTRGTQVC